MLLTAGLLQLLAATAAATSSICPSLWEPADNPDASRHAAKPPSARSFPRGWTRFSGYRGGCSNESFSAYARSGLGDVWWPQYPVLNGGPAALEACFGADGLVANFNLTVVDISNYVPGDTDVCDGSPPASGGVCEYHLPPSTATLLQQSLGDDHYLGMDNGEQDGRWIGRYAKQHGGGGPGGATRLQMMGHFARHFERMADDLGGKLMALNSLYFPHYFGRTGLYTALAAEAAQGLPNVQLFYAFLRGAMKQFATLLWGNVSIYNRFGFKQCTRTACSADGTSLSLLKKLMLAQLIYGVAIFGFEGALVADADWNLTPLGRMQAAANSMPRFSAAASASEAQKLGGNGNPQSAASPCVFLATVAVVVDVESGWAPPRHLYAGDVFRSWGTLAFDRGDHLTHGIFDFFFPAYQDSSYFHDEAGFSSPTPYGDIVDVLQSDAPSWIIGRYSVVVLSGVCTRSGLLAAEVASNVAKAVRGGDVRSASSEVAGDKGTTVVAFADTFGALLRARGSPLPTFGVSVADAPKRIPAGGRIVCNGATVETRGPGMDDGEAASSPSTTFVERVPIDIYPLTIAAGDVDSDKVEVLCTYDPSTAPVSSHLRGAGGGAPLAPLVAGRAGTALVVAARVRSDAGGELIVVGADGVAAVVDPDVPLPVESQVDASLNTPYPLAAFARGLLDNVVSRRGVTVNAVAAAAAGASGPTTTTCRSGPGNYTVLVTNPSLSEVALGGSVADGSAFVSGVGPISSVTELPLDSAEKKVPGYLPKGYENATLGLSGDRTIAGADARLFEVVVNETAAVVDTKPSLPEGRQLRALRVDGTGTGAGSLDTAVIDFVRVRPTFFAHFGGVVVDWRWVEAADGRALNRTARFAHRQGLRVIVDFSSGINLYPDLRLVNNSQREHSESMARIEAVLAKMLDPNTQMAVVARDAVFTLHIGPENYYDANAVRTDFVAALAHLAAYVRERASSVGAAAGAGPFTLHLSVSGADKQVATLEDSIAFVMGAGASPVWKVAASVALLFRRGITTASALNALVAKSSGGRAKTAAQVVGMWLCAAPANDPLTGQLSSVREMLSDSPATAEAARAFAIGTPHAIQVVDALMDPLDQAGLAARVDAEFNEVQALEIEEK